jgi:hypothetical protein
MTYFTPEIFKNILAFCDDRIEVKQRKLHTKLVNDIDLCRKFVLKLDYYEEKEEHSKREKLHDRFEKWFNTAFIIPNDSDGELFWISEYVPYGHFNCLPYLLGDRFVVS